VFYLNSLYLWRATWHNFTTISISYLNQHKWYEKYWRSASIVLSVVVSLVDNLSCWIIGAFHTALERDRRYLKMPYHTALERDRRYLKMPYLKSLLRAFICVDRKGPTDKVESGQRSKWHDWTQAEDRASISGRRNILLRHHVKADTGILPILLMGKGGLFRDNDVARTGRNPPFSSI
jgi:hypothetical protein